MTEIPRSKIPRLIRNCRLNDSVAKDSMLLMPEGVLKLKGPGAAIVKLCNGERTVAEIIETLQATYSASSGVESDALEFLNTLLEKRVIDLL